MVVNCYYWYYPLPPPKVMPYRKVDFPYYITLVHPQPPYSSQLWSP